MSRLTEEERLRVSDLFTPAELVEALDLQDLELLSDVLYEYAEAIRDLLGEHDGL